MTGDSSLNPWSYTQTDAKALQSLIEQGKIKIEEAYLTISSAADQNLNDVRQNINTAKYLMPTIVVVAKDALGNTIKYAMQDAQLAEKLKIVGKDLISHVEPGQSFFKKIDLSAGAGIFKNSLGAIQRGALNLIDEIDSVLSFDKHLRQGAANISGERIPFPKLEMLDELKGWAKVYKTLGKVTTGLKVLTLADAANDLINHGSVQSTAEFTLSIGIGTLAASAAAGCVTGLTGGAAAAIIFVAGAAGSYYGDDLGEKVGKDLDKFLEAKREFLKYKNEHPNIPEIGFKGDDSHAGVILQAKDGKKYVADLNEFLKDPKNKEIKDDLSKEYELFKKMYPKVDNCNACLPSSSKNPTLSH